MGNAFKMLPIFNGLLNIYYVDKVNTLIKNSVLI